MRVNGRHFRSIWLESERVFVIDQRCLPHQFVVVEIRSLADAVHAIRDMIVRGAPLIGATAAYGLALAMREDSTDTGLGVSVKLLAETRPTAVNLRWALERMRARLAACAPPARVARALEEAAALADEDAAINRAIGEHGAPVLRQDWRGTSRLLGTSHHPLRGRTDVADNALQILTHCNAGWLATVDYGTALAPIYALHDEGVPVHVWVDETRPRNQGASLTAWELAQHGVPHTVIVDNAGGLLMQQGWVDVVIVGTDRVAANGDVANKIGTYLKALAAKDSGVPFYVACPTPTIDFATASGAEIPIEYRTEDEIRWVQGADDQGETRSVRITPEQSRACNPGFDITPVALVTALITERGVVSPSDLQTRLL